MKNDFEMNLCSEMVNVLYEDPSSKTRTASANLEQISREYAVLLTDDCPQPGCSITFDARGHNFYGTVESVELDDTLGCFAKIKLDSNSRWHGRVFVPEHFLALCSFAPAAELDDVPFSPKTFTLEERSGS